MELIKQYYTNRDENKSLESHVIGNGMAKHVSK